MKIVQIPELCDVPRLHREIFGEDFPYESYREKLKFHKVYIYVYYEDVNAIGYSLVIDQAEEKNLYAWYGGLLPAYQGNGLTSQFFDMMVEKARDFGYKSISLATTNARPNMLRLAIKYGFDIVDVKKRDTGEENKIYFKFFVHESVEELEIALNQDGRKTPLADIERMLVRAYKSNCSKIYLTNVLYDEDIATIKYVIAYCKKFMRKIPMSFDLPRSTT